MNSCDFCGAGPREAVITAGPCRCGAAHRSCGACWRQVAKISGEFPEQDFKLSKCPPKKAEATT